MSLISDDDKAFGHIRTKDYCLMMKILQGISLRKFRKRIFILRQIDEQSLCMSRDDVLSLLYADWMAVR